jgi:hypothetical protein
MLASHLNPNGLIVLETGNWESWHRLATGDAWSLYLFDHQFYFSLHSLTRVVDRVGHISLDLIDANRERPSSLRHWPAWARAKARWPQHGDIPVMAAVARHR